MPVCVGSRWNSLLFSKYYQNKNEEEVFEKWYLSFEPIVLWMGLSIMNHIISNLPIYKSILSVIILL